MIEEFLSLREIHGLFDDAEEWLVKKLGVPTCIGNCGRCCLENTTTVYALETSLILSYLIGSGKISAIDWARGWLLEKHSVAPTYEGIPYGVVTKGIHDEWDALLHLPCIFLTSDKRCFIYEMRPLTCRAYGVTRLPSPHCPRPLGKGESHLGKSYVGGEPGRIIKNEVNAFFAKVRQETPDLAKVGILPTMLFKQAREREFRELILDNKIASAKLVGTDISTQYMWQDDIERAFQLETDLAKNIILN